MTATGATLLEQALALPPTDRVRLAADILASVDEDDADPKEVERLWADECERRVAQLGSGDADLLTWEQVLVEIEADRSSTAAG